MSMNAYKYRVESAEPHQDHPYAKVKHRKRKVEAHGYCQAPGANEARRWVAENISPTLHVGRKRALLPPIVSKVTMAELLEKTKQPALFDLEKLDVPPEAVGYTE